MKQSILPAILLALLLSSCKARVKEPGKVDVATQLVSYYNTADYDRIFQLYSVEMQKALPLNKTTEFFEGLKKESGLIARNKFIETTLAFSHTG
jgi:hypothetical protein